MGLDVQLVLRKSEGFISALYELHLVHVSHAAPTV